jgi:hypothetical protein
MYKKVGKSFPFLEEIIREFYEKCFHFQVSLLHSNIREPSLFQGLVMIAETWYRKCSMSPCIPVYTQLKVLRRVDTAQEWNTD